MYNFDLRKLLRRYSPIWFRWAENQSMAYALCWWLWRIDAHFFIPLRQRVALEYRYNGLVHSLEWMLNDRFDPALRRIYINTLAQLPYLYYRSLGEPPQSYYANAGNPTGFYHFDLSEFTLTPPYRYEFRINVPDALGITPKAVFEAVDTYRYAGCRPAVRSFDTIYGVPDTTTGMWYYDQFING